MSQAAAIGAPGAAAPGRRRADLRRRSAAVGTAFVILALFLIAFPKGGIKISGVPLTWGYILLGLISPLALITISAPPQRCLLALALSLPFMAIIIPLATANAFNSSGMALGFIFSVLMNFGIFPVVFYGLFSSKLKRLPPGVFVTTLVWCIRFIAIYGIFLFVYKTATGGFFQIPYLTVNAADAGNLADKPIMRAGGIAKLISTYNNGNIYGACLPLILPVYLLFERNPVFIGAVWASQFLTISRTAWAGGLFLVFILYFIGNKPNAKRIFRGLLVTVIGLILVVWLLQLIGRDITWLFDPSMGGRMSRYDGILAQLDLLPSGKVSAFGEMVYMGILLHYGIVGFLCFLPFFFGGLFMSYRGKYKNHPVRRAARQGLMAYMFLAISDGAILLIPVMVFFYFTTLLALEGQEVIPLNDPDARALLK